MKLKLNLAICATGLGLCLASSSASAVGTTENFNVTSSIIQSIALDVTSPLRFGERVRPTAATSVTIAPADAGAALLTATGTASRAVQGSFTSTNISMACSAATPSCAGTSISVDAFRCSISGGANGASCSGTFDAAGAISSIKAGATEHLVANQLDGSYSGTQTFSLDYV